MKLNRFLSLTLPPNYKGFYLESVKYINKIWAKFRIYLERKYGKKIDFIKVVEKQKRGVAHLHILVDRYIPQAWISEAWQSLGGGKIVDIRYVDVHRVSGYVSKYMTKDMLSDVDGHYRRYGASQGIDILGKNKVKKENDMTWQFVMVGIDYFLYWVNSQIKEGVGRFLDFWERDNEVLGFKVDFVVT